VVASTVGIVAAAAAIRWLFDPLVGDRYVFPLFLVASGLATWRFGVGAGLAALLIGYAVGDLLFVAPRGGTSLLALPDPRALGEFPLYAARGLVLVVLVRALGRKQAALRRANEHFETLAAGIADVLWIFDTDRDRMVYVSPVYERVFGRSPLP